MNTNSISVQLGTETSLSARMETGASLTAGLATEASFAGQLGTGAAVVNDYRIQAEEIEDGHRLTITRGSEVQSFDVMNGTKGDPGEDAPQEAVLYTPQSLTVEQQAQVRENIGIAEQGDVITYEVGSGRQFESFTDCLRALEDNEQSKRIDIYEGSYDIYSELGGQTNPMVPPNTEIVGHGRVELMASDGSDLSIVNLSGSAKLKNLMITCSVGYACVRADAHGETPNEILKDMIARRVPPPAGDRWQLHQIAGMLHNEKYTGDVVLQKNYIESHLTHREVRNKGEVPMYHIHNAHPAIIDRRLFAQAAAVTRMRRVRAGNSSYPYDTMLRCPHCGEILVHGALYPLYFGGRQLRNGGWGCYGPKGCRQFLMIQNVLDAAMLDAHEKKYGSRPEKVDYWWLDELVESINFHEDMVNVRWKDGDELTLEMNPPHPHYVPANAAARYNAYLERIRSGEARTKCKFIMGL